MIHVTLPQGEVPTWLLIGALVYFVFWVWSLAVVLSDKREGKEIEKLTWVVVLIFLPLLGVVLYGFLGPGAQADMAAAARRKPWEAAARESTDQIQ